MHNHTIPTLTQVPAPRFQSSALQKCKGYYNLGVVISVASVQRVLLYPHDYCVQTSHRDSNCYILLPELVVKDCKSTAIMGNPEQMQLR